MKNMIERESIKTKDYRQALKALKDFDAESFYARIDKFYGQIVDIIEGSDQL